MLTIADPLMTRWGHDGLARPYWRLYWNTHPGWTITYDHRTIALGPERIVLIAPETIYRGQGRTLTSHVFLHFTCDSLPGDPLTAVHVLPCTEAFILLLVQLRERSADLTCDAIALACHALGRLPQKAYSVRRSSGPIAAAQSLAERFLHRSVTNDELARVAKMHVNAFIRRFRADTGETPRQWHLRRRIDAACVALEAGHSIDTVAENFGFCDRHHLTRVFTRIRGCGPATYRESATNVRTPQR